MKTFLEWTEDYIVTELLQNDVNSTTNGTKFDTNQIESLETPKGKLKFVSI